MTGAFEFIRTETARGTVGRLNRTVRHLDDVDTKINEAISRADLGPELATAKMLVGELLEETPALSRTIDLKVSDMLATDRGSSVFGMYAHWQAQAQSALEQSLDDEFRAGQGDLGGTYSMSYRGGFSIDGSDDTSAGTELVHNLLLTTGDPALIAQDEFQLILVDDGKYILVLPGVTDLTSPNLGVSDRNRTVRDLDAYAVESAASTDIDGNKYAQMVQEAMIEARVPFGSEVAIVGHSYGADTALDLAADSEFNGGPRGYDVTHVVAAAYASGPQLEHVQASTEVLVLQNHHDAAVLVEGWGHGPGVALHDDTSVVEKLHTVPHEVVASTGSSVRGMLQDLTGFAVGSAVNVGADVIDFGGDVIDGAATRTGLSDDGFIPDVDIELHINDFDDIFFMDDGVTQPRPNQTVDVFEGAWAGGGHAQTNYAAHVATTDDPLVLDFFESLGAAGFDGRMERWSIDVSVPEEQ